VAGKPTAPLNPSRRLRLLAYICKKSGVSTAMQQQEPTPFNPQPAEAATDIDSTSTTEDDLRIPPVDLLLVLLLVVVSVAALAAVITLS
jgi:hypothetical protein